MHGFDMSRILIAEDHSKVRETIRRTLVAAGFEVREASNGAEALQAFRSQPADLVLCDMFMPDQDGLETIKVLRREFPAVKIIAISGGGSVGMDMLPIARHLGAIEILYKPFAAADLLAAIELALQKP